MIPVRTFFFALLVLSYLIPESTFGQSASLMEAAKKEGGKVFVYGSLQDNSMEPIGKGFQAKTGLELNYWRGTATKVMDRVLSENRAGKPLYDVVLTSDNEMDILKREGIFAKYDSPVAKDYPASMKIMAKNGESVNRKGVYPPIPDIEKVKLIAMEDFDVKGFAEKKKEYQQIFFR
jgi:hypothetical protein